jgi:signal transduction histidine kinase
MQEGSEQGCQATIVDASPAPTGFRGNQATRTISLRSPSQSRQKRASSAGWLSTSIVHDLRNPLGTVLAGAEMLMQLNPTSTQGKRLATNIYRAAGRMRELLADLACESCGYKSPARICKIRDVVTAASEAALPATEKHKVQILNEIPGGLEIPLERSRMERVFVNLIANALEAMPHGGKIHVRVRNTDNSAFIEVEDTGPGIPIEILDRLFEPFITARKDRGLGLGLALSRQTVRDHGGDMWVEPAPGARFVVRLPLNQLEDVV